MKNIILLTFILTSIFLYGCGDSSRNALIKGNHYDSPDICSYLQVRYSYDLGTHYISHHHSNEIYIRIRDRFHILGEDSRNDFSCYNNNSINNYDRPHQPSPCRPGIDKDCRSYGGTLGW